MKSKTLVNLILIACLIIGTNCANKDFRNLQINKRDKGNLSCLKHLQDEIKSLSKFIKNVNSIMLVEDSNIWSETKTKEINHKYRIPTRYSHIYKLKINEWLIYNFHLLSNENCECLTDLEYYQSVKEKLLLIEELNQDTIKKKYIESIGKSKFDDNYRLIVFGKKDNEEQIILSENRIGISDKELDWKFGKYGFIVVSVNKNEDPLIYFNNAVLIDLNKKETLGELKPIL